jgi:foldase protein PrsA
MRKKGKFVQGLKWGLTALLLVLVVAVAAACGTGDEKQADSSASKPADSSPILIEYKGGTLTQSQFETFMNVMRVLNPNYAEAENDPEYKKRLQDQYVAFAILSAQVDKTEITDFDTKVAEQLASIKTSVDQSLGEGGYEKRLAEFNVKSSDLKDYVEKTMLVMNGFDQQITAESVQKTYDEGLKAGQYAKTTATVSHILIGTNEGQENARTKEEALQKAQDVLKELKGGLDFAAAAKQYSDDPGSKDNGGEYADADVDNWVPEFRQAAIDLPLNQISEPVQTDYGYHIMKVTKRSQKEQPLAEVEGEIRSRASQQKYTNFMEKELAAYIIKRN